MSVVEIRADLIKRIANMDERFLEAMHLMAVAYDSRGEIENNEEIIGYTTDTHAPIYKNKLAAELDATVARVKAGDFITLEELEAENW